jgi:hypothetical protein
MNISKVTLFLKSHYSYEDMDDYSVNLIEQCDIELQNAIFTIEEKGGLEGLSAEFPPLFERIKTTYHDAITDMSTFRSCFATNAAYKGIRCQFIKQNDGTYLPDFTNRYLLKTFKVAVV